MRREIILDALKRERKMTVEQLARLAPQGRFGQELKPHLPKPNARPRLGAGSHIQKVLRSLISKGEVRRDRHHASEPFFYFLSQERFSDNWSNKHHERACADIFVAYT